MNSTLLSSIDRPLLGLISVNLVFQHINKKLESQYGLSIVQWSLLKKLVSMPTVAPLVLAKALRVTPGTLSQTLARLTRKQYIFICNDSADARKKMISITRTGKEALDKIEKYYESVFSNIEAVGNEITKIENFLESEVRSRL